MPSILRSLRLLADPNRLRILLLLAAEELSVAELLAQFDLALSDVAFAARMANGGALRDGVQEWLSAPARRPADVSADDWLAFEQDKHERLLAAVGRRSDELELMETR